MTWRGQFVASLASCRQTSPEAVGYWHTPDELGESEVLAACWPALGDSLMSNTYDQLESIMGLFESPIEEAMALALLVTALYEDQAVEVLGGFIPPTQFGSAAHAPHTTVIEPQYRVGKYRADLRLAHHERWNYGDGNVAEAEVLIECDGHDYHERTKEQAKRDKSRDRALQAAGFTVLRFTGSEIYADPFKCAREAYDLAVSGALKAARAIWDAKGEEA